MAALLWWREREITDGLLDLLVRVVHKIGARAERRVEKELLKDLQKVTGKTNLLFRMAEAAVENPEGTVREVLYPVVGELTLKELVREYKGSGPAFRLNVHARLSSSYRGHYRRMLAPVLGALDFRQQRGAPARHRGAPSAARVRGEHGEGLPDRRGCAGRRRRPAGLEVPRGWVRRAGPGAGGQGRLRGVRLEGAARGSSQQGVMGRRRRTLP